MSENLAYKASSGCWAYDNNESYVKTYGRLYNWETAKSICPVGWHLPTNEEWNTLINFLGGEDVAGGLLKSTQYWESPNAGATNSHGFCGLPAGNRELNGSFVQLGKSTAFWSSTPTKVFPGSVHTWIHGLNHDNEFVNSFGIADPRAGFSVRCIKN
jgi:uncharacterized protein (TIGR02145 family)